MAVEAIEALLSASDWELRSFDAIKARVGDGFDDATLRRALVGAGALRFSGQGGQELWGLKSRNEARLRRG